MANTYRSEPIFATFAALVLNNEVITLYALAEGTMTIAAMFLPEIKTDKPGHRHVKNQWKI